jgi:hypothetical protein
VAAGLNQPRGNPGESLDVPAGVYVITPDGKLLGRIPIPEDLLTNLAFGGPGHKTLYVTAGKTVYRFPVNVAGASATQSRRSGQTDGKPVPGLAESNWLNFESAFKITVPPLRIAP